MPRFQWEYDQLVLIKGVLMDPKLTCIVHIKDIGYAVPKSEMRQSLYANNAQVCLNYFLGRIV